MINSRNRISASIGESPWRKIRTLGFLSCSVLLLMLMTACQTPPKPMMCDPTPPKLNWTKTVDGQVCLSPTATGELVNYIHDLKDCINQ